MPFADPRSVFRGKLSVIVPHMDDCVLACGGTTALLPSKPDIHFVYATDGAKSPPTPVPWVDRPANLPELRKAETREALALLGIPESNRHFLDLPDNGLRRHADELLEALVALIRDLEPDHVFMPFRYDRHPDHLALNRAVRRALHAARHEPQIFEYFVYYRWRLLPRRDVRSHIRDDLLTKIDIASQRTRKRQALECFRTQTTRYFPWQDRPILTETLLDEVCDQPEMFLRYDPTLPGPAVFESWGRRFRIVHRVEPPLKRLKDLGVRLLRRDRTAPHRPTPGGTDTHAAD